MTNENAVIAVLETLFPMPVEEVTRMVAKIETDYFARFRCFFWISEAQLSPGELIAHPALHMKLCPVISALAAANILFSRYKENLLAA